MKVTEASLYLLPLPIVPYFRMRCITNCRLRRSMDPKVFNYVQCYTNAQVWYYDRWLVSRIRRHRKRKVNKRQQRRRNIKLSIKRKTKHINYFYNVKW